MKKINIYIGIGVLLAVFAALGIYWYDQKISPEEAVLKDEEMALNQDLSDLESLAGDESLGNLEYDLTRAAGENVIIETASIEKLESEFADELNSLSSDFANLEGINNDASLDALDGGLSNI